MDLIQKIKEQSNQASALLPGVADMAASNEVITVDINNHTYYDEDALIFEINDDRQKAQILDWLKSKAKFLRFTFTYNGKYYSTLFTKDAISNADSPEYYTGCLNVISSITPMSGDKYYFIVFDLEIKPSENSVSFQVHSINHIVPM